MIKGLPRKEYLRRYRKKNRLRLKANQTEYNIKSWKKIKMKQALLRQLPPEVLLRLVGYKIKKRKRL